MSTTGSATCSVSPEKDTVIPPTGVSGGRWAIALSDCRNETDAGEKIAHSVAELRDSVFGTYQVPQVDNGGWRAPTRASEILNELSIMVIPVVVHVERDRRGALLLAP